MSKSAHYFQVLNRRRSRFFGWAHGSALEQVAFLRRTRRVLAIGWEGEHLVIHWAEAA